MHSNNNGKMQFATEESLKSRLEGGDLIETPDQDKNEYQR